MDGVKIRIGDQTRELRFSLKAVDQAEALCGGEDIWTIVATKLSLRNLKRVAAAGFSTYGPDPKRISPAQVENWLELDPTMTPVLERAVQFAVHQHLNEIGKFGAEDLKLLGEAYASVARDAVLARAAPAKDGTSG